MNLLTLDYVKKRDGALIVGFLDLSSGASCKVPNYYGSFNVVIEAFWVNYPYCYNTSGCTSSCDKCTDNIACAYPLSKDVAYKDWKSIDYRDRTCKGFSDGRPDATGSRNFSFDTVFPDRLPPNNSSLNNVEVVPFQRSKDSVNFFQDLYDYSDEELNNNTMGHAIYFNSFHTASADNTRKFLKNKTIIKLASFGGWYMGGSIQGEIQSSSSIGRFNNWAVCLENPAQFVKAIEGVCSIGYEGFDIDCETVFAGDTTGLTSPVCGNLRNTGCYGNMGNGDSSQTVSKLESLFITISQSEILKNKIFSLSPRVKDICVITNGIVTNGFFGELFDNLQNKGVIIDMLNIQFYNDEDSYSVTINGVGENVINILKYVQKKWPFIKNVQVGIIGKAGNGTCDAINQKYCITSDQINSWWNSLKTYASGIMLWGINHFGTDAFGCRTPVSCENFNNTPLSDTNWLNCCPRNICTLSLFSERKVSSVNHRSYVLLIVSSILFLIGIGVSFFNIPISIVIGFVSSIIFIIAQIHSKQTIPSTPDSPPSSCPYGMYFHNNYCSPCIQSNCGDEVLKQLGQKCTNNKECITQYCSQTNQCGTKQKGDPVYDYNFTNFLCRKSVNDCYSPT